VTGRADNPAPRIDAEWVHAPGPVAVMAALGEAFFVGGCVRNALLGAPSADIDIATPLLPDEAARRLAAAGIKTVATGLKHGTQTAIWDGEGIEVTTFRKDIETDGRRAVVHYTTDIAVDASRRDFTMNALYADAAGRVIDPLGGYPDLMARRVRFIGRPEDRIREDYLRILRFFRFHAWYGEVGVDQDGLAACAALADGIAGLARERIGWEFRKLLGADDPAHAMASMAAAGVLARCLPGAEAATLGPLVHVEALAGAAPDWLVRLAALGGEDPSDRLRLSKAEAACLHAIQAALADDAPLDVLAYRHGARAARAAHLIRAAATGTAPSPEMDDRIAHGAAQHLPVTASDLMAEGVPAGPALGRALARAEARWVESRFSLAKPALLRAALSG